MSVVEDETLVMHVMIARCPESQLTKERVPRMLDLTDKEGARMGGVTMGRQDGMGRVTMRMGRVTMGRQDGQR